MKKFVIILMTIFMMSVLCGATSADTSNLGLETGQVMPDFTVSLTDGSQATLSELLKENDLVVLNIFASWCGPCEVEFPEMEKVYQANSSRMEIVSVSGDPDDTMEVIADYKASHGLSFPMGLAGDALGFINVPGFPTTLFIDKQGQIGLIKIGAFVEEGAFETKVNYFLSQDYSGETLEAEIAKSNPLSLLLLIIMPPVLILLMTIARWRLFRKAGKPRWHSLIPILSTCQEYALCWKGWVGLIYILCGLGIPAINVAINLNQISTGSAATVFRVLFGLGFLAIRLIESTKLANAFGKSKVTGILLWITGSLGRVVLGFSKANYKGAQLQA